MRNTSKKSISLLLAIAILASAGIPLPVKAAVLFSDVKETAWYYDYVNKLYELKITSGTGNNKYSPDAPVTRAEFVTFLCKIKGYEQTEGNPFVDSQKSWATGYITIALNNGIMDLPENRKFRPGDAVTRLEAVEMMCRALDISKNTVSKNPYSDVKAADIGYTNAAFDNYLMVGSFEKEKKVFKPSSKLTRGEVASIVVNAYEFNKDKIGYLNDKMEKEKEKLEAEKKEQESYKAWQESVKGISKELLNNTKYLDKSVYESNREALSSEYFENWGKDYGMSPEQVQDRMIHVATVFTNAYVNENYKNIEAFNSSMKESYYKVAMDKYLQEESEFLKEHTLISEGTFKTSKGLFVINASGLLELRGTVRYRYLSSTSQKILNKDIISDTGKPAVIGTWYEQDVKIYFSSRDGIKCSMINYLNKARIAK